ncbi:hypothetical protein [Sorangium cellulosum]|nr:hypothetical protein [Sorangium cellulosum]
MPRLIDALAERSLDQVEARVPRGEFLEALRQATTPAGYRE